MGRRYVSCLSGGKEILMTELLCKWKKHTKQISTLDVMGMVLTEIDHTPALLSRMEMVKGLIVTMVRWGGVADQSGVEAGDIISEVNGQPVRTLNDLKNSLAVHECREPIRFLFHRVRTTRFLALPCERGHSRFDHFQRFGRFEVD
jgi:predicted metalloprotease with PDZ domain